MFDCFFLFGLVFFFLKSQCNVTLPATVALELIGSRILSLFRNTFALRCACT